MSTSCDCGTAPKLIYACSGAADVGGVSDLVARKLTKEGVGKMSCLVGIGGRVSGLMKSAEAAKMLLAIDGCPLNCAKKCLEEAGFSNVTHLQLGDVGLKKGETEINDFHIEMAAVKARAMLEAVG